MMILFNDALLLLVFWLNFGEINRFSLGFVLFLTVGQILAIVGARFREQFDYHARKDFQGDWADYIGAWWLMACFFGPLLGWICGIFADNIPNYWQAFHLAKVFFTIVLPVLTMLTLIQYVEGKAATIQIPLLFFVTLLPILFGLNSVAGLWNSIKP